MGLHAVLPILSMRVRVHFFYCNNYIRLNRALHSNQWAMRNSKLPTNQISNSFSPEVNECLLDNGGCSHGCVDTVRSHYCTCPRYLYLDDDNATCTGKFTFIKARLDVCVVLF